MNKQLRIAFAIVTMVAAGHAAAQITFYEGDNFRGRAFTAERSLGAPTERCWVERQQVSEPSRGDRNVGGALAGALIGA